MAISAIVFPFDSFGSAGTGAGALILGDILHEACEDAAEEEQETRLSAYTEQLEIVEAEFDTPQAISDWRSTGETYITTALQESDFTVWLSGNHLGVMPVFEELNADDLIIQLDAHYDGYDLSDTSDELSHGNFLRFLPDERPKILHLGSRDLFLPTERALEFVDRIHTAEECHSDFERVLTTIRTMANQAERVWLDIDVDALDPAFAPGVILPMPFGFTAQQLWRILEAANTPKFVGMSLSEFSPGHDVRDTTLQLLAWFLERALLLKAES
jgi:agmatinase